MINDDGIDFYMLGDAAGVIRVISVPFKSFSQLPISHDLY
jgi:hypothetical protein